MPLKMSRGVLTALDIYGHPIQVHHRGEQVYKTKLGTFFTLITYALIIVNTVELITKFRTKSDQTESFQMLIDPHIDTIASFKD